MLRFETKLPPKVATILEAAIDFHLDMLEDSGLTQEFDIDEWASFFPNAYKIFTPALAIKTLEDLKSHIWDKQLWDLNDYHYLLLYEVLEGYTDFHNNTIEEIQNEKERKKRARIGKYTVYHIDLNILLDTYFWDLDFLTEGNIMLNLHPQIREAMNFNDEVFSISQGLPVHPEELVLREFGKHKDREQHTRASSIPEPPSTLTKAKSLGEDYWAMIETTVKPFKNIPIKTASAIAHQYRFELRIFNIFDDNVREQISVLDPVSGHNENCDSGFLCPDGPRPATVWVLSFFRNSMPTALFFHSLGFFLVYKKRYKKSFLLMNEHFISAVSSHGFQQAQELLSVTAWSYGCLFALYYDMNHMSNYHGECLEFMAFEGENAYAELEAICASFYKSQGSVIKKRLEGCVHLDEYLNIHNEMVQPVLEEFLAKRSGL